MVLEDKVYLSGQLYITSVPGKVAEVYINYLIILFRYDCVHLQVHTEQDMNIQAECTAISVAM